MRARELVARSLESVGGRRNAVRIGRYLLDHARLDVPNDMATNGELLVQASGLRLSEPVSPIVVFDVGAHFGEWSLELMDSPHAADRSVALHVFEPAAFSFARLEAAVGRGSQRCEVSLNRVALSSSAGAATLYKPHEGAGSSSLHDGAPSPCVREEVSTTTVDIYCDLHGIEEIHLLKCDAEGHDFDVLLGAGVRLQDRRVSVLQFEYNARWIHARRYLKDAFDLLTPLAYRLGKVTPKGVEFYEQWEPELESFREGNYVAVREREWSAFPRVDWWKRPRGRR